MNIFKLISLTTGTVITVSAAYQAQKKVNEILQDNFDYKDEKSSNITSRAVTVFATTAIVGGAINRIINRVFHLPPYIIF